MNYIVLGIVLFAVSIAVIELLRFAFRHMDAIKRSRVKKRIKKYTFVQSSNENFDILKKRVYSEVPLLNSLLQGFSFLKALDNITIQANTRLPVGFFLLSSLLLGVLGYVGITARTQNMLMAVLVGFCGLVLPFGYLAYLKRKRLEKFQEQLPEGLDLIARSLKAGHAFTSGMKLAADEFPDPLGMEFQDCLEEINFGVSVHQSLKGLGERMVCAEVKFFVVAVILQRETGGNLAELLESLAQLMREKVKFEGKVRALAAEGKITAVLLVLTPFLMALYLELSSPGYMSVFFTHPVGKMIMLVCLVLMLAGVIVLRRMVDIKV
jgi:tight adherence protein B